MSYEIVLNQGTQEPSERSRRVRAQSVNGLAEARRIVERWVDSGRYRHGQIWNDRAMVSDFDEYRRQWQPFI